MSEELFKKPEWAKNREAFMNAVSTNWTKILYTAGVIAAFLVGKFVCGG